MGAAPKPAKLGWSGMAEKEAGDGSGAPAKSAKSGHAVLLALVLFTLRRGYLPESAAGAGDGDGDGLEPPKRPLKIA